METSWEKIIILSYERFLDTLRKRISLSFFLTLFQRVSNNRSSLKLCSYNNTIYLSTHDLRFHNEHVIRISFDHKKKGGLLSKFDALIIALFDRGQRSSKPTSFRSFILLMTFLRMSGNTEFSMIQKK